MKKKLDFEHILLHSTFQMMAAIVYGFGVFMLMERGYSASEAGLCLSLTNVINFVLSPIISNFLDNSKKYSIFESVPFLSIIVLIAYTINYFLAKKSLLLSFVFILGNAFYALMEALINSYSSTFQNNGIEIGFSSARAFGSLSYGVMCAIFGVLSVKYSYSIVVLGGIFFISLLLFITILIRKHYYQIKPNQEVIENLEGISFKEFIKNNKLFLLLCVFLTGIFLGYTCVDNFMLLVTNNVGGTSSDMGNVLAVKAIIEAISIFLFPLFVKRIRLENLLILSAFCFVLKSISIVLSPNVLFIYLTQIFQSVSFGFIFPGIVEYVYRYMNDKEAIRGNACFTMTISLGSTLSSVIGGYISDLYGVKAMEIFAFIITLISCVGFIIIITKMKKENYEKVSI